MARRRKGVSDSHFYYKWLDKALCDLQCARLLLTYGGDNYNIAFHCQQAIEKALKGYLLYRTDLPFEIDEREIRRYLDMAERMFAAIRRELYAGGRPHPIA